MNKAQPHSPSAQLALLFRKAGVFLLKGKRSDALKIFRAGKSLAQTLGDEERLTFFRQEIAPCAARDRASTP